MKAYNATMKHKSRNARDDRPSYLRNSGYVLAVDTETTGLRWWDDGEPFIATASDFDRDYLYTWTEPGDCQKLRDAILAADILVFHNASFDIHVLVHNGIVTLEEVFAKEIHDTDLLARCVLGADNGPFGLKRLATEYLDGDAGLPEHAMRECMVSLGIIRKTDQKDVGDGAYYKTWMAYPAIVEEYAIKDTRYTHDLFTLLLDKATEDNLKVYELERAVMPVIIGMEHKGVKLDPGKVAGLKAKYERVRQECFEKLYELNGYEEINFDSNPQIADFLIRQGVPLRDTTPGGEIRVDKWALEKFEETYEAVAILADYRQAGKFLSTYIGPMEGREVVHPNFWQIGARTGRMSCSNPNMQNIPVRSGPEVREIFVPREGYVFLVADYSSIELRLAAYYMNHDKLWKIIEEGDPFLWLGEQIYGTPNQDEWPVSRSKLKNGYYALTYGAGGPKLASTIGGGMTAEQGKALAQNMKSALGGPYRQLNKRIREQIEAQGFIKTLGRRTQHVSPDKSYVGLNALIQGSAADIMKWGLVNAAEALKEFDGYPVLVVHDEIVAEVPAQYAEEALVSLCKAMTDATDVLNLKVSGTIATHSYAEGK